MTSERGRVPKACESCRRRKVRCNGSLPCSGCEHLGLSCSYESRTLTSRAGISRGAVVASLRSETVARTGLADIRPAVPPSHAQDDTAQARLSSAPDSVVPDGLTLPAFLNSLLHGYRAYVYPACPILEDCAIEASIARAEDNEYDGALCYAFGAVTIALESSANPLKNPELVSALAARARQSRPQLGPRHSASLTEVVTLVFLRIAYGFLQDRELEFFYLREAITMLQMRGVDRIPNAATIRTEDQPAWQRLYWVLYISERLLCIKMERMAILTIPHEPPCFGSDTVASVQQGFYQAASLYRLIDNTFLRNWCDRHLSALLTMEWITQTQNALAGQKQMVETIRSDLAEWQHTDLAITVQWLRTLVWQMAGSKHLLHSDAREDYMHLLFPVQGSTYLEEVLHVVHVDSIARQGANILYKLFDIIDTATNMVSIRARMEDRESYVEHDKATCRKLIEYLDEFPNLAPMQRSILRQNLAILDSI